MLIVIVALALADADPKPTPATPAAPATATPAAPVPAQRAPVEQAPVQAGAKAKVTTALMSRYAGKVEASASTSWSGWGPERLVDGDPETSWFSARGDAAAKGKKPWVMLRFPAAVDVKKVSLMGNREPNWPKGFTIEYGVVDLLDDKGAVIASKKNEGKNVVADVDFTFKSVVNNVRAVRFTSLTDQGDQTAYEDIALAEMLVE